MARRQPTTLRRLTEQADFATDAVRGSPGTIAQGGIAAATPTALNVGPAPLTGMVDTVPGDASTTFSVAVGGSVSGWINGAGDRDWFSISLVSGQSYTFALDGSGGTPLGDAFLRLYDSTGTLITSDDDGGAGLNSLIVFPAPASGTYFLGAGGFADVSTGQYTLSAAVAPPPPPPPPGDSIPGNATTTVSIAPGQAVVSAIDVAFDVDWVRTTLSANTTYHFSLVGDGATPLTSGIPQLRDAAGALVVSNTFPASSLVYTPTQAGTFYVDVSAFAANVGGYALIMNTDNIGAAINAASTINLGQTIQENVSYAGDQDWYAISLTQGLSYLFTMTGAGATPLASRDLRVMDSAGAQVLSLFDGGALIGITPTVSGTYFISAQSLGSGIGGYALTAASEIAATTSTQASLTPGATLNSALEFSGDADWVATTLSANTTYHFSLVGDGATPLTSGIPQLRDAAGALVVSNAFPASSLVYTPTQAGTFYVDVRAFAANVGGYALTMNTDNIGAAINAASAINLGQTIQENVNYAGDQDWYAISLTQGLSYLFTLAGAGATPLASRDLRLLDSAGAQVFSLFDGGALIGFTPAASGTYFISAQSLGSGIGGYALTAASEIAASTSTLSSVAVGAPLVSAIDFQGDRDWVRVDLVAGAHYQFTLDAAGASPVSLPQLRLIGGAGNVLVTEPTGNRTIVFTATETGSHYIDISAFAGNVGDYSLRANTDAIGGNQSTTSTIAIGNTLSGAMDFAGDRDWYGVQLSAGVTYRFELDGVGAFNTFLEIRNAAGGLVRSDNDSGIATDALLWFTPSQSGLYYVAAEGVGNETGSYTLSASTGVLQNPLDTILTNLRLPGNTATYYFANLGEFDDLAQRNWTTEEIGAVEAALATFEAVADLSFTRVNSAAEARFVFVFANLSPGELGLTNLPAPGLSQQFVRLSAAHTYLGGALASGGQFFNTLVHEMGHALGLNHPQDGDFESQVMEGVISAFGSYGQHGLNQGAFTAMGYNPGWPTQFPHAPTSITFTHGGTPMALDIGALQFVYGQNPNHEAGDNTYALALSAGVGVSYSCIWDTGGIDWITYAGAGAAQIDLRAATLISAPGGGGYVSYVAGVDAGFTIAAGVVIENASGGAGADTIRGNSAANVLQGGDGADTLEGGAGGDQLDGGLGTDTVSYASSPLGVNASLTANSGSGGDAQSDTLIAVENLRGSMFADTLTGNAGVNFLSGEGGADVLFGMAGFDNLDGGAGADQMFGGEGDDFYIVDNTGDVASETSSAWGHDTVFTSVTYALGANIEDLDLTGFTAINGSGNNLANRLTGNLFGNVLFGFGGDDIMNGNAGADQMFGGEGNDTYRVDDLGDFVFEANPTWGVDTVDSFVSFTLSAAIENLNLVPAGAAIVGTGNLLANVLTGNGVANTLFGMAGNDTLNGAAGADQMFGGEGDDLYIVDNVADLTFEAQSTWGLDTVQTSVTYQLGQNIDNLVLQAGAGALTGRGNLLNNAITGNEAANTLFGFAGNDTLNGSLGADQLYGREGDDIYVVDNLGDVVAEANAAWGTDTILASVTYFLAPNLENLTLTGAGNINATGNSAANIITGNSGANALSGFAGNDTLDGGGGADALFGGEGDDTYIIDHAGDVGFEANAAWGTDLVQASVSHALGTNLDNLTLTGAAAINGTGNTLANVIIGNSSANALFGLGGADTLNGGAGSDNLEGGAGDDAFVFAPGSGSDAVSGFVAGGAEDTINLSAYNGTGITWAISQAGADTVFAFSNGDQITLLNVIAANLVQTDPFGYG